MKSIDYVRSVQDLVSICRSAALTEIDYAVGSQRIRVARHLPPVSAADNSNARNPTSVARPESTKLNIDHILIKSKSVGIVKLLLPNHQSPTLSVGSYATKGQHLLSIVVLGTSNAITSPFDGIISGILVKDGQPVEYDQALLAIAK